MHTDIFCNKRSLLKELNRYESRLKWHIQRLYRTRNAIIHSGEEPINLRYLSEHLHDYVDEIMTEIIEKLACDNSLANIDNVIMNSQVFMKSISTEYKGNKDTLSEQDIRLLIGY